MATVGTRNLSLMDTAKMKAPDGRMAMMLEALDQKHSLINDLHWEEANDGLFHETAFRATVPTPSRRAANTPVNPSRSTYDQARWGCTGFEAWTVVDHLVAERFGNPAAIVAKEMRGHVEGFRQTFSGACYYDNPTGFPNRMQGLAPFYAVTSAAYGRNLLKAGGSGSVNTSVWVVDHGPGKVYGVYPKGSAAGMKIDDFGLQVVDGATGVAGSKMKAYVSCAQWLAGLVIEDWECAVRVANIDTTNLVGISSAADVSNFLIRALNRLRNPNSTNIKIYMNRTVFENFSILRRDDVISGGGLTWETVDGVQMPHFQGKPIRIDDQILNTEATVS